MISRTARTAVTAVAALLLAGGVAGCSETIKGTPGPAPTAAASGDFPSTDSSTGDASPTDTPTDEDSPTDDTTGTSTNGDTDQLCSGLQDAASLGPSSGGSADLVKSLASLAILGWGFTANTDDPYAVVDGVTEQACPDARNAVLKEGGVPDLKSTKGD